MPGDQLNSFDELQERIAAIEVELMHARRLYQIALLHDDHITLLDELRQRILNLTNKYNSFKRAASKTSG
jgi:hypothetical protein